jgi:hypothetical protein
MNDQQRAAMRCALEALEEAHTVIEHRQDVRKREEAITALREALAQPQGEWVDLTDDDISDTYAIWWRQKHVFGSFTHAAIAKFKEKNTPPVVPQGEPVAWMSCLDGCNQVVLDEDSDSVIRHNGTPLVPAPVQPVKQEEAKLPVVRWLWADKYGNITNRMYTESEAKEQIASAIKLEWSRTEFPE